MSAPTTESVAHRVGLRGVARRLLLLAVVVASCAPHGLDVERGERGAGLNGRFELLFDGEVRALSLSERALVVRDDDGRPLDVALAAEGRGVSFALRVDEAMLAAPPGAVVAELAAAASSHAITARDGRRLTARRVLRWANDDVTLATSRAEAPRVRSVRAEAGRVTVLVDGVLEPLSLRSDEAALVRDVDGVALGGLPLADLRWLVVGETTEVSFALPEVSGASRLQFDPRRVRWADVEGRRLSSSPPIDIEGRAGGS